MHKEVIQQLHDSPERHLGVDKTEQRFLAYFYWPNARKPVADYIRKCSECEKFKTSRENTRAEQQPIVSTEPLDLVEIDFVGPLPVTRK